MTVFFKLGHKKKNRLFRILRIYCLDFLKLCFGSYPIASKLTLKQELQSLIKKLYLFIKIHGTAFIVVGSLTLFLVVGLLIKYDAFDKGTTGDSFNGLIGPFIALLSAILVYRSFLAQTESNNRQTQATEDQIITNKTLQSQWRYETYLSLFNDVKLMYNGINCKVELIELSSTQYTGEAAIKKYAEGFYISKDDKSKLEKDLESVLRVLNYFFQKLKISDIQEKDIMLYIVIEFYQTYMQEALINFRNKVQKDGNDKELAETIMLINYCNDHYRDLLEVMRAEFLSINPMH